MSSRPALYQVVSRVSGKLSPAVPLDRFPFVIGRAADAALVLDAPGVWPRHLTLELVRDEGLVVTVEKGALATLGDDSVTRHRLRHGDEIRVGGVHLQFLVSPPARRSLRGWEMALWLLLGAMAVAQVCVALAIPRE